MRVFNTKYGIIILILLLLSCNKYENKIPKEDTETNLEQKPEVFSNSSGEKIILIYFAKENEVAVKIKINNRIQELTAKGTNSKGEPVFSNKEIIWELMDDGHSGKLTSKEGKTIIYK